MRGLIMVFVLYFTVISTIHASWAFPFVVYGGNMYGVTDEEVEASRITSKLGKVTHYSDKEGSYGRNFSNSLPKGTEYFAIDGIDVLEAIAIKSDQGTYIKAIYKGKYAAGSLFEREHENVQRLLLAAVIVLGLILITYMIQKRRNAR